MTATVRDSVARLRADIAARGEAAFVLVAIKDLRAVLDALAPVEREPGPDEVAVCPHGIRYPWQCDDCDRENPMPKGWKP